MKNIINISILIIVLLIAVYVFTTIKKEIIEKEVIKHDTILIRDTTLIIKHDTVNIFITHEKIKIIRDTVWKTDYNCYTYRSDSIDINVCSNYIPKIDTTVFFNINIKAKNDTIRVRFLDTIKFTDTIKIKSIKTSYKPIIYTGIASFLIGGISIALLRR